MFPCCSRVCCPCCSPYSRIDGGDEEELELQSVITTDGGTPVVGDSDSEEEDITENAVEVDFAGYRGIFSNQETASLTGMCYSILRICDYFQIYLLGLEPTLPIARRGLENGAGNYTLPICRANNTASNYPEDVPQWIYPCGITPNGTFPNGRRPFELLNQTTGLYSPLEHMNYSDYFRGRFEELAHTMGGHLVLDAVGRGGFLLDVCDSSDRSLMFPYGLTGTGDMILRHPSNFTPQYPYASVGISNNLTESGDACPRRIFNSTHFFGGGYLGWEEPGFDPIYPCGIHPDGLFTGEWLGFPNGTIPDGAYPFGYFPNGTFPYVDYFFNPGFNHSALYLAVQNNQTGALQNYTSFLNASETGFQYHHIPTNSTEPFARCYDIYPRRRPMSSYSYENDSNDSAEIDPSLLRMRLWGVQLGAELAMFLSQNSPWARRRVIQALYLGTRTANILHSAIDLVDNVSHVVQHGPTEGQGVLAVRNVLTLTDALSLANDAIYFSTPALQSLQRHISERGYSGCLRGICSPLQNTSRVVRNALGRLTAIVGALGVACTAGLGATLTVDLISNDEHAAPEQRLILGTQIAVAAVATAALCWITRINQSRADRVREQE